MISAGLAAIDPGALRRVHGLRAAGAALSTWLSLRWVVESAARRAQPDVVLFGVAICFISALIILDPRRRDRSITMGLAVVVVVAAAATSALVGDHQLLRAGLLLALIFCSFAARRWGLRAGELALLAAMSAYFAASFGADLGRVGWYVIAAVTGIAWLWCWQFVLLPYRPGRSIDTAVAALRREAANLVGAVHQALTSAATATELEHGMRRRFRRVCLTRRVIESQFPAVLAPEGWTPARVAALRLALYDVERGLEQLVDAVGEADALTIPQPVTELLLPLLDALESLLETPDERASEWFAHQAAAVTAEARSLVRVSLADAARTAENPPEWLGAAARVARGCTRVAGGVEQLSTLARDSHTNGDTRVASDAGVLTHAGAPPPTPVGRYRLHPTTALGVQAVVATGAAMALASIAGTDHVNWVFWSAFVVIAGSAGESLRRTVARVGGTVTGAAAGALLAFGTPSNTATVAVLVSVALFFAVFAAPMSYPLMVVWLNVGFVVMIASFDAGTFHLVIERSLTALAGAMIAALVALVVFPVRISGRYRVRLADLLLAADDATARWVAVATSGADRTDAAQVTQTLESSYEQVERLLPGVVFESSPMIQSRSALSGQGTQIAAIMAALRRLAEEASEEPLGGGHHGLVVPALQQRIHDNIVAVRGALIGRPAGPARATLDDIVGSAAVPGFPSSAPALDVDRTDGVLWALVGVHRAVVELAASVGMPTSEEFDPTERPVV